MKRIPLSNNRFGGEPRGFALIDDEDYELVSSYSWALAMRDVRSYAQTSLGNRKPSVYMHRLLLGLEKGDQRVTDHRNGDGLDNRRSNLRVVTTAVNARNLRSREGGTSRYRGVSWFPRKNKWRATAMVNYRQVSLGYHINELDAARAVEVFWTELDPTALEAGCNCNPKGIA